LALPEPKPKVTTVGKGTLKKTKGKLNLPEYRNAAGTRELPFRGYKGQSDLVQKNINLPPHVPNGAKNPASSIILSPKKIVARNGFNVPNIIQRSKAYSSTVNNLQPVANVSKGAEIAANVARVSGGTVHNIIDKGLVNMAGQRIEGAAVKKIFDMPKNQLKQFEDYAFETHNIDRVKQQKRLTGKTIEESKQVVSSLGTQFPHFKERLKEINTLLTGLLREWGVKSGLVDNNLSDLVQSIYKNYVPGYREMKSVGAISTKSRGMGPAKIINRAIGGDEPLMSLQKSIPMLINRTVKAARKNGVYQEILKEARNGNPYATIIKPVGKVDGALEQKFADSIMDEVKSDGIEAINAISDKALSADPKHGYMLTVMEEGKPIRLSITEDLFVSLKKLDNSSDDELQKVLRLFKKGVTNPFKALTTGYNPFFAVRNVARDIPTAYIQGSENNPFKFVRNLGSATKSMLKKDASYQEYEALGGSFNNYFNIERGVKPKTKLLKFLSAVNNFTETIPRFGEYKGTIRREGNSYATKMKALHNGQEVTVNFGRHGDVVKAFDAVVPYLNPAVQGLDKTVRTLRDPVKIAKALGVITTPIVGLYALNQIIDKKGYDRLDNRTKDTYYVIPLGSGKFKKLPKTRELGVLFGVLFERTIRQVQGQKDAFKGFGSTVANNFLIQNPVTDNMLAPFAINLPLNKDFAGRNIVPQYMVSDKRSPYLQYDETTSSIAKTIGEKFNISPKQIDYLLKSYGGIVSSIIQPATTKGRSVIENTVVRPFTADSAYNNDVINDYYDKLDKLKRSATDKNITQNMPSATVTDEEKMSNLYQGMTRQISQIRDGITSQSSTSKARESQQKLLDILSRLNKVETYEESYNLKQELIAMADTFTK